MSCIETQELHTKSLMKKNGVVGTAVGQKWENGTPSNEEAILVFVEKKYSKQAICSTATLTSFSSKDLVPSDIDGIKTDVISVGQIKKQSFRSKVRPVKPGYSVGHGRITAGTIGGVFIDKDGDPVILSNNHVLANENSARRGDLIFQPGPTDSRQSRHNRGWPDPVTNLPYIGTLKDFVRINRRSNTQDSATAKIHSKLVRDGLIDHLYPTINTPIAGFNQPSVNLQVQKCGRTTGYTTGRIIGLNASFMVGYDLGNVKFDRCVVITPLSRAGDSGSIIMDMNERAVGLLFAGSPRITIANNIDVVRNHYGLRLWDAPSETTPTPKPTPKSNSSFNDGTWRAFVASGTSASGASTLKISAKSNLHCYLERPISKFRSIQCNINTGTDGGATWGPGLVVQWPNGMLKVNLRAKGSFGGYFNSSYNISVGKTQPNKNYTVRIRNTGSTYQGQVKDGGRWHTVIEVPVRVFPFPPVAIRLGKTDLLGHSRDHRVHGNSGTCTISDLRII